MNFSMDTLKNLPEQFQAFKVYYGRLSEREKYIVAATIGGVILFFMFIIYTTFWGLTSRMAGKVERGREALTKMEDLKSRYKKTEKQVKEMEAMIDRTPPDFQIQSHLEKLAQKNGVKIDNSRELSAQNSSEYYRELQLAVTTNKLSLRTLINFLYDIENGPQLMRISTLKIKPDYQDLSQLSVSFVVSTFQPIGDK